MCWKYEREQAERERIAKKAIENRVPCIVCNNKDVIAAGTWLPDKTKRLAAGGNEKHTPVFAYCLCADHIEPSDANHKLIAQAILREVRLGRSYKTY